MSTTSLCFRLNENRQRLLYLLRSNKKVVIPCLICCLFGFAIVSLLIYADYLEHQRLNALSMQESRWKQMEAQQATEFMPAETKQDDDDFFNNDEDQQAFNQQPAQADNQRSSQTVKTQRHESDTEIQTPQSPLDQLLTQLDKDIALAIQAQNNELAVQLRDRRQLMIEQQESLQLMGVEEFVGLIEELMREKQNRRAVADQRVRQLEQKLLLLNSAKNDELVALQKQLQQARTELKRERSVHEAEHQEAEWQALQLQLQQQQQQQRQALKRVQLQQQQHQPQEEYMKAAAGAQTRQRLIRNIRGNRRSNDDHAQQQQQEASDADSESELTPSSHIEGVKSAADEVSDKSSDASQAVAAQPDVETQVEQQKYQQQVEPAKHQQRQAVTEAQAKQADPAKPTRQSIPQQVRRGPAVLRTEPSS